MRKRTWKVLYQAEIRNGFVRVGEVHKLTKTKKKTSVLDIWVMKYFKLGWHENQMAW